MSSSGLAFENGLVNSSELAMSSSGLKCISKSVLRDLLLYYISSCKPLEETLTSGAVIIDKPFSAGGWWLVAASSRRAALENLPRGRTSLLVLC